MPLEPLRILIAVQDELFAGGLFDLFTDKNGLPMCDIINCNKNLINGDSSGTPDIALIDLSSADINGEGALRRILKVFPHAKINILSLYVDSSMTQQLKEAGINGYLKDGSKAYHFVESLKALISGDDYLGNNYKKIINKERLILSDRELQVLSLIAKGYTDLEIAGVLSIRLNTVNGYRKNMIAKLNVRNSAELVAIGIQLGYITV